ncbi:hypothetical protein Z043_109888, partial [Scleropages formosus]
MAPHLPFVLAANQSGETALDVARRLKNTQCEEALVQASAGKFNPHVHVEYEWNLRLEEIDESDDDLDDKPSPIKKERSPRPQSFCHSSSLSTQDKLSLPAFTSHRDKQRLSYGAFTNQVYSASTDSPTSPILDAPPLPPRNAGKVPVLAFTGSPTSHYATLAGIRPCFSRNDSAPTPASRTPPTNKFEGIPQQQSNTKSTLGPRVLPRLPQKVELRKIETIHHPSVDKPSQPPEVFQKPPPAAETPQKAPPPDKPQLSDLPPKPQISDLPPKPQLADLPPKPQLAELPPKPQIKNLPPKPQLADMLAKPPVSDAAQKPPASEPAQKPLLAEPVLKPQPADGPASNQQGEPVPKQASEDTNGTPASATEMPVPLPRKINTGKSKARRVKTIYDCQADNDDELTFSEGEVIIVTGEEDQDWWPDVLDEGFGISAPAAGVPPPPPDRDLVPTGVGEHGVTWGYFPVV